MQVYVRCAGDSGLLLVRAGISGYLSSEHNTGYIFMGPPWGSNGTPRVQRQGGKKRKGKKKAGVSARESDTRRREWKKEEQGFSIDVIVSVRHPSHSSFLRAFAPAPSPIHPAAPPPYPLSLATACCPDRKLPPYNGGGLPFKLLFHLSSVFLFPRSSTHRLQYYHLPLFRARHPPLLRRARASHPLFHRRATPPRRGTRPLIYTCTSDHNINFNDGRDENIRTGRYLWRLSWPPSLHLSRV